MHTLQFIPLLQSHIDFKGSSVYSSSVSSLLERVTWAASVEGKYFVGGRGGESCLSLICEVLSKFQPKRFFSEVVWSVSAT